MYEMCREQAPIFSAEEIYISWHDLSYRWKKMHLKFDISYCPKLTCPIGGNVTHNRWPQCPKLTYSIGGNITHKYRHFIQPKNDLSWVKLSSINVLLHLLSLVQLIRLALLAIAGQLETESGKLKAETEKLKLEMVVKVVATCSIFDQSRHITLIKKT